MLPSDPNPATTTVTAVTATGWSALVTDRAGATRRVEVRSLTALLKAYAPVAERPAGT